MMRIALVEDEQRYATDLTEFIYRYGRENGQTYEVCLFSAAESFLFSDVNSFDLIFMDIQLPKMNGMDAAKKIRETNPYVGVVFVTSLAQFAINGYEVGALDYITKPFTYYNFALKFARIVGRLEKQTDDTVVVRSKTATNVLRIPEIYYVEIAAHTVTYHTANGKFSTTGTMKNVSEKLAAKRFSMCNQCYMVNLRYVTAVNGNTVTVAGKELVVSRPRKREFLHDLNDYIAMHGGG